MGSINFTAGTMIGSLSDTVGSKTGLALTKDRLIELLERRQVKLVQDLRALGDDDWVRIHSSAFEEAVESLLYSLGALESERNLMPMAALLKKFGRADMEIANGVGQIFVEFMENTWDYKRTERGHLDPAPFMKACAERYGRTGLDMAFEFIQSFSTMSYLKAIHFPHVREWNDAIDLEDLFRSEGLSHQIGSFIDQRYIDYLSRNFDDIDHINWRKFEYLTAEWFARQGMLVDPGPGRNDDGVDVRVWPGDGNRENPPAIIVQCKRVKAQVDKVLVKSVYADVLHERAGSGLIVTTSQFSPGAKMTCQARSYPVEEANRGHIRAWVEQMRKPGMGVAN